MSSILKKAFGDRAAAKKTRTARQSRPRRIRLGVEALEQRELMSANQPVALLGNWNSEGGYVKAISTTFDIHNKLDAFGIGGDNAVWYRSQSSNGTWSNWTSLGGYAKSISTILDGHGNTDVFTIGGDNAVWYRSQSSSGTWSNWTSLGGIAQSITTTLDSHNNLDVFAIGSTNALWYRSQAPTSNSWSGWTNLGGWLQSNSTSLDPEGTLKTNLDSRGNLDVFGIGSDKAAWYRSQSGVNGSWSAWNRIGGAVLAISTSFDGHGNLDLFTIGTNRAVYYSSQSFAGGSWSGWKNLGGVVQSICTGLDGQNNLDVFTIGTDDAVYYQEQPYSGTWSGWMGLEGDVKAINVTRNYGTGTLDVTAIGSDNALWSLENATYSPMSGTLFGSNGPSYSDVKQGVLGDCWLLASLAAVAARAPSDITSMFTYDGTTVENGSVVGLYTVRFYNKNDVAQYVTVDTELPDSGYVYDHPVNNVLWVALAEKAYVEANALGIVNSEHVGVNDYDALNFGYSQDALQAITGKPASNYSINPSNIAAAWNQGKFIVLCTTTPVSSHIVGNHCYALVDYNSSWGDPYKLYNPWGDGYDYYADPQHTIYGLFFANGAFLSQNFSSESQAGAAAVTTPGQVKTELPIAPNVVSQAQLVDTLFSTLGVPSNLNHPQYDRIADMLALSRADSAAGSPVDDVALYLAMHKLEGASRLHIST
jgi:hypothetical protein